MKEPLTYMQAYVQLEELIEQLEDGSIEIDKLSDKVKQANELIAVCEAKLRKVEEDVNEVLTGAVKKGRKKEGE
jgi:exodeoxyribonuclease VII small subunit